MGRRTRERVVDPEGVEHVQTKPPRADVLHYPSGWVTILVRRTHDEGKARLLAYATLLEIGDLLVHATSPDGKPELGKARAGWWTTAEARFIAWSRDREPPPPGAAVDAQERHVAAAAHHAHGAGPGVEFLAGRAR